MVTALDGFARTPHGAIGWHTSSISESLVAPQTRYAKNGDVHIAYQVVGDGPRDLVVVPPATSHLELMWEEPHFRKTYERFASFSRLILLDKRGTGLSDQVAGVATLEERMEDVRAVMDAAGSEKATLMGASEGGPMSLVFAGTYPERTVALILVGSIVAYHDLPWRPRISDDEMREALDEMRFDDEAILERLSSGAPSAAEDEHVRSWWLRFSRAAASPGALKALSRMNFQIDVRGVLSSIRVPTLVIQWKNDQWVPVADGRYLAEHIPGAKYAELPGRDHIWVFGDIEPTISEIQEFFTGVRPVPHSDRVLATVLFTDIVGSTEKATELGDHRWRALLDNHDHFVRTNLTQFRGKEIDKAGDGFLATFDGPARAIRCAQAISTDVGSLGISIRAGLHTGEVELRSEGIGGIGVHIGARVAAVAGPGEVLVSRTVKDLVAGSGIEFEDRGVHTLKGVPDDWRLFAAKRG